MAVSAKVSNIVNPGSTGDQATTGVGFQPKALLFFGGRHTSTGELADVHSLFGFSGTSAEDISFYHNSLDAAASSDVVRSLLTTAILKTTTGGATTAQTTATLSSLDSDGFTLNFTAREASAITSYLALGGSDITNSKAGTFAINTSTGNQSITGLGFRPDVIIFFTGLLTTTGTANNNNSHGFGVATSSSARWSVCGSNQNSQTTMNNRRYFSNSKCFTILNVTADTIQAEADFVSMDSDGFTIDLTTAGGTAYLIGYLAIKGGRWKAGNFQQPNATTGNQSVTGVGFLPSGVIFGSAQTTTNGTVTTSHQQSFGVATSSSARQSYWFGDSDNVADAVAKTYYKTDKVIQFRTQVSSGSTLDAEADYVSNDIDGFTVNWTTCDANTRYIGYLAFGTDYRALTDSEGITDVIAYSVSGGGTDYTRNINEAEGITDVVSPTMSYNKTRVDSEGITDTVGRTASFTKNTDDSQDITDSINKVLTANRSIVDNVGISDAVNYSWIFNRSLNDSLGLTDTVSYSLIFSPALGDSEGITDMLSYLKITTRDLLESIGLSDAVSGSVSYSRTLIESLGISDNVQGISTALRYIADSIGITDVVNAQSQTINTPTVHIFYGALYYGLYAPFSEAAEPVLYTASLSDPIGITDNNTVAITFSVNVRDSLGMSDSINIQLSAFGEVDDAVGITDAVSRISTYYRSVVDNLGQTDSVGGAIQILRELSDQVGLTDYLITIKRNNFGTGITIEEILDIKVSIDSVTDIVPSISSIEDTKQRIELYKDRIVLDDISDIVITLEEIENK